MVIIPGFIISLLTFPGVIIHELSHFIFCRLRKIPVFEVKYLQLDMSVMGYVIHAEPEDFKSVFLISAGPLIFNTLLCLIICLPASIPYIIFNDRSIATYFFLWLGVSIGMHAFPSSQDAMNLWERAKNKNNSKNPFAILSIPFVLLIRLANILSFFWFDVFYGFFIGILVPQFLIKMFF